MHICMFKCVCVCIWRMWLKFIGLLTLRKKKYGNYECARSKEKNSTFVTHAVEPNTLAALWLH